MRPRLPTLRLHRSYSTQPKRLLIVYHSFTKGAAQMANAAYEAASSAAGQDPSVAVSLQHARDTTAEHLLSSSAYLFATPENLASMAGIMKDLFDRTYYPCLGHLNGRAYAALVCAGSDGEGAMRQLDRICTGWRLKKVAEGIIVITHAQDYESCHRDKVIGEGDLERCREVGAGLVEGLKLGMFCEWRRTRSPQNTIGTLTSSLVRV